jgi:hypothetical protein
MTVDGEFINHRRIENVIQISQIVIVRMFQTLFTRKLAKIGQHGTARTPVSFIATNCRRRDAEQRGQAVLCQPQRPPKLNNRLAKPAGIRRL